MNLDNAQPPEFISTSTSRLLVIVMCAVQGIAHLFWLNLSAHSGQTTIPYLLNQGMVLFGNVLEQHAPGTSVVIALAQRLVPVDPLILLRVLNASVVIAITLLVHAITRHQTKREMAALTAAAIWAWWAPVYGYIMFYFNTLVALCVLVAGWILLHADASRRVAVVAGLWMGAATAFKQHAWLAAVVFGLWVLLTHKRLDLLIFYALGSLIIPALIVAIVAAQGNLGSYVYWNWTFNLSGLMDGIPLDGNLFRKLLLTCAAIPAFVLLWLRDTDLRKPDGLLLGLWTAMAVFLYPRFGEGQAIGMLPFTAILSGVVAAYVLPAQGTLILRKAGKRIVPSNIVLSGLFLTIGIGWLWTGAASYIPQPLGLGSTVAYDELRPVAAAMAPFQRKGDTLFVLPETDSTPQLHILSGMLPAGTWIKGWRWYFDAPGVFDKFLTEWRSNPPTFIVLFPERMKGNEPYMQDLWLAAEPNYELVRSISDVFLHGKVEIYRRVR